jgi:hypothetical protein
MLFRQYPAESVTELAALAYAAYDYGGGGVKRELQAHAPAWRALGAAELGLRPGDFDSGYYDKNDAAGYVAVHGDRVAIVFRGSDSTDDLLDTAFDQDRYFDDLRPLIRAALDYAAEIGASEIVLTGHSLGGAMVQRAAAKMHQFEVPAEVRFQMVAFGPPGTDVGNKSPLSRSVLNVEHSGDPVTDDPALSDLTQHGAFARIELPYVAGADDLYDLARQKEDQRDDPSIITEHDMLRYLLSVDKIAASALYPDTTDRTVAILLEDAGGQARDDDFAIRSRDRFLLALDGDDTLAGSARRDLIDGGAGDDVIDGGGGDDVLAGGPGDDLLTGGPGVDLFVLTGDFGTDTLADFAPDAGERIALRGVAGPVTVRTGPFGDRLAFEIDAGGDVGGTILMPATSALAEDFLLIG